MPYMFDGEQRAPPLPKLYRTRALHKTVSSALINSNCFYEKLNYTNKALHKDCNAQKTWMEGNNNKIIKKQKQRFYLQYTPTLTVQR